MTDAVAVARPILPSADLCATEGFYEVLGVDVPGQWPDYLIMVGPGEIELHFWPKPDATRGEMSAGQESARG